MTDRQVSQTSWNNYYSALLDDEGAADTDNSSPEDENTDLDSRTPGKELDQSHIPCRLQHLHYNSNGDSPVSDHARLFHQHCPDCASRPVPRDNELCSMCQHLRLRHVLHCLRKEPTEIWYALHLGTVQNLVYSRTPCSLCQFLKAIIVEHASQAVARGEPRVDGGNPCLLKFINQASTNKIERPGGLILSFCFQNKPSTHSDDDGIFLHFRCLDGSSLARREHDTVMDNFFYEEVKLPNGYSRKGQRKIRKGGVKARLKAQRADVGKPLCDWEVIKTWLNDCRSSHKHHVSSTFANTLGSTGPALLIDVHRYCVVDASPHHTYAAISYVWGSDQGLLKCTKTTKDVLMKDQSLLLHQPPLTITDAMSVCRELGVHYLWVDSLCIVRMGEIYSRAMFTIAGVDGASAQSGLCGVSTRRRVQQTRGTFDGLEAFEILNGYGTCVMKSLWSSRGWTYQEACLSQRLLLFTDQQVFFRCAQYIYYEDPSVGNYGMREWPRWNAPTDIAYGIGGPGRYDAFVHFGEAIAEYSSRNLTLQSDVFDAFSAIIRRLYLSTGGRSLFGLPETDLDKALLWEPQNGFRARSTPPGCLAPSWSWASHAGRAVYTDGTDLAGSEVEYSVCQEGELGLQKVDKQVYNGDSNWGRRPIDPMELSRDFPEDIPRAVYMSLARCQKSSPWRSSDFESNSLGVAPGVGPLDGNNDIGAGGDMTRFGLSPSLFHQAISVPGRLLFRAPTAKCRLRDHSMLNDDDQLFFRGHHEESTVAMLTIFNKHDRIAGFISMHKEWIKINIQSTENQAAEDNHDPEAARPGPQDDTFTFVALSVGRSPVFDGYEKYVEYQVSHNIVSNRDLPPEVEGVRAMAAWWDDPAPFEKVGDGDAGYAGDRIKDVRYYDAEGKVIERTPMVNVMLIEKHPIQTEGVDGNESAQVYKRIGVGVVYLARWMDAEPEMDTIILE